MVGNPTDTTACLGACERGAVGASQAVPCMPCSGSCGVVGHTNLDPRFLDGSPCVGARGALDPLEGHEVEAITL